MNIWIKSLLAGLSVAILAFLYTGKNNYRNRLKEFNARYIIRAVPSGDTNSSFAIEDVIRVLNQRLESLPNDVEIKRIDSNTISVSVPGISDSLFLPPILTSDGKVQFWELYNTGELLNMLTMANEIIAEMNPPPAKKIVAPPKRDSMSRQVSDLLDSMEIREEMEDRNLHATELIRYSSPYQGENPARTIYPAEIGRVKLKDTATISKIFGLDKLRKYGPADIQLCFGRPDRFSGEYKETDLLPFYFLKTRGWDKAILENEDIHDARMDYDTFGTIEVNMEFNRIGARKWAVFTKQNIGRSIAIVVNGSVISAPNVTAAIEGSRTTISGGFTVTEAQNIVTRLKEEKLPARMTIISSTIKRAGLVSKTMKKLLVAFITLLVFTGIAWFIFKTLKPT